MVKSVYIHIPFCNNICTYCDFCKMFYNEKYIDDYLLSLENEIKSNYKNEVIETIYIGGGSPSCLTISQLKKLFRIIKIFKLSKEYEFSFECNIEDLNYEKLKFLFDNKVNRLSIGIQTFNDKLLKYLGRNHTKEEVFSKISLAYSLGFKNINVDLIYAIPNETLKDLEEDLDNIINLNIQHVSCYSLIIEPHTKLYIDNTKYIEEDLDYKMYQLIKKKLSCYNHYEISNYAKEGYYSKHNLTYWNNLEYYGFGLSASGYIDNIRYTNTYNIKEYIKHNYVKEKIIVDFNLDVQNTFMLSLRKVDGINKKSFYNKYKIDINKIDIINDLIKENKIIDDKENIKINNLYTSNNVLIELIDIDYEKYRLTIESK